MAGFAPEVDDQMEPAAEANGQFGIALEPQVIKICLFAMLVGMIGGLVAQGLLELIYLFTNIFFYGRAEEALERDRQRQARDRLVEWNHAGGWGGIHAHRERRPRF